MMCAWTNSAVYASSRKYVEEARPKMRGAAAAAGCHRAEEHRQVKAVPGPRGVVHLMIRDEEIYSIHIKHYPWCVGPTTLPLAHATLPLIHVPHWADKASLSVVQPNKAGIS
ncbi:hypothetical protein HaLaN_05874 [Haematococcus lacustris]|uniref:Uncharacterized protein n=1 Tax=Haematococcus lacustris TaxID=44745 RepID=A0A699YUS0_HAELA|nr:hypothetical protein HaLaN_05874 [Haematococcus lacustris]